MPLTQSIQKILQEIESLLFRHWDHWGRIFLYPNMRIWARITIAATVVPFSYGHFTTSVGFFTARIILGVIITVMVVRIFFVVRTKYTYMLLVLFSYLYYIICLVSLVVHPTILHTTPAVLSFLPMKFLLHSVFLGIRFSIYLNVLLFLLACVPFVLFLIGPNAQSGWTVEKQTAACIMAISFAAIFLTYFSTLAARLAAANLEQMRSEIVLEKEREKFRSDLAHMNRLFIIETMSTTLHHEISQPINAASLYLGAVKRDLAALNIPAGEVLSLVEKANHQIEHVFDIVKASRMFARKGEQRIESVDLVGCVYDVLKLLEKEIVFHGINIEYRDPFPNKIVLVNAVKHEVVQIIANLLLNSIEAFDTVARDRSITIAFVMSNFSVDLQVLDNGIGLSFDTNDDMFANFVTTKENGTGLGLPISKGLAEKFGGRLSLEPRPQGGAIATLRLPLSSWSAS